MGSLSSYGGKLSNFGNTGTTAATPDGIDELILAMGGWKTNGVSPITPSIAMSRTGDGIANPEKWVAPCAVGFSADLTTDTAVTNPWHECLFYWDFGDADQENEYWSYGARPGKYSKNHDYIPTTGHVYTKAGTYTITLTVLDAYGNINATTQEITVTDPDVIFSGTKTICISNDPNETWDGAPVDAVHITSSNVNIIETGGHRASLRRYMFKRGQTFEVNTTYGVHFIGNNNVQITSFGDASLAKPTIQSVTPSTTMFRFWAKAESSVDNVQIHGLKLANPNNNNTINGISIFLESAANSVISEKGHITNYDNEYQYLQAGSGSGMGCAVVGCYADVRGGAGAVGLWSANGQYSMFIGNYIDNNGSAEHSARLQGGRRCVFAYNTLKNPSPNGKHALTLRGSGNTVSSPGQVIPAWSAGVVFSSAGPLYKPTTPNGYIYRVKSIAGTKATGGTEPTWPTTIGVDVVDGGITWTCEYVDTFNTTTNHTPAYYISNYHCIFANLFADDLSGQGTGFGGSAYLTAIHTSNATHYEYSEDIIWDSNLYHPNMNTIGSSTYIQLYINYATRVTVRNNIINYSKPVAFESRGIAVVSVDSSTGVPNPDNIWIYNNSFFSSNPAQQAGKNTAISITPPSVEGQTFVVKNNIVYGPDAIDTVVLNDATGNAVASNNSTDTQAKNTNPFTATVPLNAEDYKLAVGSYARAAGVDVLSAFLDFYGTARDRRSVDLGAISKDS
jgi:hypothetical protein